MPQAALKLQALLASANEKIQLAAAGKLLETGLKLREQADLEERLQALERKVAGKGESKWQSRIA
jgi:hypothetical protein